jgi:peptidoglycan/LPS O-acetylase OafA/YrhL
LEGHFGEITDDCRSHTCLGRCSRFGCSERFHLSLRRRQTVPVCFIRLAAEGTQFGWAGVSLFFVLSGFLISGILWDAFDQKNWWTRFYWRRSLRIFPLYYFALSIAFVSAIWMTGYRWPLGSAWPLLVYLQNVPFFFPTLARFPNYPALGHFWSLAVEEQFYLVWPFLLAWRHGSNLTARRMCLLLWAMSLGFRVLVFSAGMREYWAIGFLAARAGELAMGAYLALAIRDAGMKVIVLRSRDPFSWRRCWQYSQSSFGQGARMS